MSSAPGVAQDALLPDGQAPVEAGVRLERLETCLPDASYDGLRLRSPQRCALRRANCQYGMPAAPKKSSLARRDK